MSFAQLRHLAFQRGHAARGGGEIPPHGEQRVLRGFHRGLAGGDVGGA